MPEDLPSFHFDLLIKHADKKDKETAAFTQSVFNKVKSDTVGFLSKSKTKRKLYVAKFVLQYTSPTGKKVPGLRPFGPILHDDKRLLP